MRLCLLLIAAALVMAGCQQTEIVVEPTPLPAVEAPTEAAPTTPPPTSTHLPTQPASLSSLDPTATFNLPVTSTLPPVTLIFPDTATPQPCIPRADWTDTYTIQPGDTLFGIAARLELTTAELQTGNCIANANAIFAGTNLRVPPTAPTATPPGTG